ncbi:DUF192 domain-containing protein [Candidatus Dojkabacteria bacterium]|nr:DUF192 domain-containing protein [Candidatus Dojkabacteria bacterium]
MAKIYPFNRKSLESLKELLRKIEPAFLFLIPAFAIIAMILAVTGAFQFFGSTYESSTDSNHINEETDASKLSTVHLGEDQITIKVEIADSSKEWTNGLMNRNYLPSDHGMLFVFPDENIRSFWMKDTYIPLDIIYINSEKEIIDIYESVEPLNEEKSYTSKSGAKYVLEVNGGFVKKNDIREGMRIYF